ncbi:MAG: GNAT family N-acetyltransferase [Alphaproteobacteria bacterium]|jgi:hypothetical protein|nr:GNAT family N-acetyltransferase [Alphaproteobacteria bacterium]MCV6598881.1 GNAT family N-acetyltransferase [Alphaproteobacteria bacterium]
MRKIKYKVTTDKKIIQKAIEISHGDNFIKADITKLCIIATHEGRICGCAMGSEKKGRKPGAIYLAWIASGTNFQQKPEKTGTNLMINFCKEAKKMGYKTITINSLQEPIYFYDKLKIKQKENEIYIFEDSIEDILYKNRPKIDKISTKNQSSLSQQSKATV